MTPLSDSFSQTLSSGKKKSMVPISPYPGRIGRQGSFSTPERPRRAPHPSPTPGGSELHDFDRSLSIEVGRDAPRGLPSDFQPSFLNTPIAYKNDRQSLGSLAGFRIEDIENEFGGDAPKDFNLDLGLDLGLDMNSFER